MQGRTVMVTGGGSGIGKSIALAFAKAGATVAIIDIDEAAAEECAAEAAVLGAPARAIVADCGDLTAIDAMIAEALSFSGKLDVLVNNAATTHHAGLMDITEADYDRINRINAKGAFFCLQRAARAMITQGGGQIINIASISGRGYAGTSNAAYAASKGALITLTRIAAHQLASYNITVNAICPGITMTALLLKMLHERADALEMPFEAIMRQTEAPIPIGRVNQPADIAAMALFLASDAARNITGQSYNVDGGLVMS